MLALKNGWTKQFEILKYLYGIIQYVVVLPMVLKLIEVVMKSKMITYFFSAHYYSCGE